MDGVRRWKWKQKQEKTTASRIGLQREGLIGEHWRYTDTDTGSGM